MTTTTTDPNTTWEGWVKLYSLRPAILTIPGAASNGEDAVYDEHQCVTCGSLFSHEVEDGHLFVFRRSWDHDTDRCQCEVIAGTWELDQLEIA